MFFTGQYNKALVALIMAILMILEEWFSISLPGLSEQWVITLLSLLSPILVWAVPNR